MDTFTIPQINGIAEIGIAAGVDANLQDPLKIRINPDLLTPSACAAYSAHWAMRTFAGPYVGLYTSAAYAIAYWGMARKEDADYVITKESETFDEAIKAHLDHNSIAVALGAIVATKVNWYVMNHHVGQVTLQGYAKKYAASVLKWDEEGGKTKEHMTVLHTIGHWASTKFVLNKLRFDEIEVPEAINTHESKFPAFSADISLRTSSAPAGTHKHSVAFAMAKALIVHPMGRLAKFLPVLPVIAQTYRKIMLNPLEYHTGRNYLLGDKVSEEAKTFSDSFAEQVLGRLGTFMVHMRSKNTVCQSPHVNMGGNKKYTNYEDYDNAWEALCIDVAKVFGKGFVGNREEVLEKIAPDTTFVSDDVLDSILRQFETMSITTDKRKITDSIPEVPPKKSNTQVVQKKASFLKASRWNFMGVDNKAREVPMEMVDRLFLAFNASGVDHQGFLEGPRGENIRFDSDDLLNKALEVAGTNMDDMCLRRDVQGYVYVADEPLDAWYKARDEFDASTSKAKP